MLDQPPLCVADALRIVTILLALTIGVRPSEAAAQDTRDAAQFAAEISRLAADLAAATPQTAAEIEKRLRPVWSVRHGSRQYDVPAESIRTAIRDAARDPSKWADERERIAERLRALAREASTLAAQPAPPAGGHARAVLDRVLADPEFGRLRAQSAMQQWWQRIVDWVAGVLRRMGLGRVANAATAEVIAWTVSLVAFGALLVWLISVLGRSRSRARLEVSDAAVETPSASAWARRAAAAEDPREAVRCGYRAAMRRLEEEGVWRVDDARTPREYLRLLPEAHRRRSPVAEVARRFEEIWFGARRATDEDRLTLMKRLRELECLPAE